MFRSFPFFMIVLTCGPTFGDVDASELLMWNRDRSSSFPQANPPSHFDGVTGENILWKTPLPNWSNSSPLVVRDRVFLLAEPWDGYAPWLICLDAKSGKELWRRELDPLDATAMDATERIRIRELGRKAWQRLFAAERAGAQLHLMFRKNADRFHEQEPPEDLRPTWMTLVNNLGDIGYRINTRAIFNNRSEDYPNAMIRLADQALENRDWFRELQRAGLEFDTHWRPCGTWGGVAYPTPCSDGKRVFVMTAFNHYSCYDFEGNLQWQRRLPTPAINEMSEAHRSRIPEQLQRNWKSGSNLQQETFTSPLLLDLGEQGGLVLLSCAFRMFRCLDAKTGEERWALPTPVSYAHVMSVPSVAWVDGDAVLITSGGSYPEPRGDELIRIRDGQSVGFLPASAGLKHAGSGSLVVDGDLVITTVGTWGGEFGFRGGSGPVMFRLEWDAARSSLRCVEQWRLNFPSGIRTFFLQPALLDGVVYSVECVVNVRGGFVPLWPRYPAIGQGYCDYGTQAIGDMVCVWDRLGRAGMTDRSHPDWDGPDRLATFHFFDRITGVPRGTGRLPINPKDGADASLRMQEEKNKDVWRWLGAGAPWAEGERLYIRAYDFLWCIGDTTRSADLASRQSTNALGALTERIVAQGKAPALAPEDILLLRSLPIPEAGRLLKDLIKALEPAQRWGAATALFSARIAFDQLRSVCLEQLEADDDPKLRARLSEASAATWPHDPVVRVALSNRISTEPDPVTRGRLAQLIMHIDGENPEVRRVVMALCTEPNSDRAFGHWVITPAYRSVVDRIPPTHLLPFLIKVVENPNPHPEFRHEAMKRIAEMRPTPIEGIKACLVRNDGWALGNLQHAEPTSEVVAVLKTGLEQPAIAGAVAGILLGWRKGGEAESLAALDKHWSSTTAEPAKHDQLRGSLYGCLTQRGPEQTDPAIKAQALALTAQWLADAII